jgi:hypothetical protein
LARRHTLPAAIAGTALLWAATFALSITEYGSDRLHLTLLTGSLAAVLATLGYAYIDARIRVISGGLASIDARMCGVSGELHNIDGRITEVSGDLKDAVAQAADELHTAVEEQGKVLRDDRIAAVRTLTVHLPQVQPSDRGRDDQVA